MAGIHVRAWLAAYRGLMPDEWLDDVTVEQRTQSWSEILAGARDPGSTLVGEEAECRSRRLLLGLAPVPRRGRGPGDGGDLGALHRTVAVASRRRSCVARRGACASPRRRVERGHALGACRELACARVLRAIRVRGRRRRGRARAVGRRTGRGPTRPPSAADPRAGRGAVDAESPGRGRRPSDATAWALPGPTSAAAAAATSAGSHAAIRAKRSSTGSSRSNSSCDAASPARRRDTSYARASDPWS